MRTFFLFWILTWIFRNPLVAIAVMIAVAYLAEARWRGRWFDPTRIIKNHQIVRDLQRALDLNEHDVASHNDLGRILAQSGKYLEALPHMERAIRRMPESPETNYFYGLCLLRTGRHSEGERYIAQALEINPRFLYGEPHLTLAHARLAAGDAAGALQCARAAVKLNTSSVEGWVLLARAAHEQGELAAAREAYDHAVEAYRHLPAYLHLPQRKWLVAAKRGRRTIAG